ncbi:MULTISPECIES: sulfotransferase family protein [unclassified Picosynechococcus]|uniref:sulfotransferase family protein n=2 Tax=Picosynechococcus TaxID=3079908 RepID=UPI000810AE0A|nr:MULTISPECIES: sulfotransferase family protein [unclassified Picosynechococcus]ANV88259.1 hypothetical protein AWQ22_12760 [Picosynechococcus sp. PCC 7117]
MMNKYQNQIIQFKIFGERHTATNAIARLLIQNFDLDYPYYDFLGWKHRKAPNAEELQNKPLVARTLFIITVRHPYEWAAAMHRWPYCDSDAVIHRYSFKRFLDYPIEDYASILDMWNQKYASYQKFIELVPYVKVIRYEDFKKDQLAVLQDLYQWIPQPEKPEIFNQYMHGGVGWNLTLTNRTIEKLIYQHWLQFPVDASNSSAPQKPLEPITDDIASMIDKQIDDSVLRYYYPTLA